MTVVYCSSTDYSNSGRLKYWAGAPNVVGTETADSSTEAEGDTVEVGSGTDGNQGSE